MLDYHNASEMSLHIIVGYKNAAEDTSMSPQAHLDGGYAGNDNSSQPTPIVMSATAGNPTGTISYQYTALTGEAVVTHQHHYAVTTHGTQAVQHLESTFDHPFRRYNGYNLFVKRVNVNNDLPVAEQEQVDITSKTNPMSTATTSYTNTLSNVTSPSYNDTSLTIHQSASSIQVQPEYEQYTQVQHSDQATEYGYGYTQSIGSDMAILEYDTAGIGAQFEGVVDEWGVGLVDGPV